MENWFFNVFGLKIVVLVMFVDAYGLLCVVIRDLDLVFVFEHKHLFNYKGEIDDELCILELGVVDVVRVGDDVTIVVTQLMRLRVEEVVDILVGEGVDVELIDPCTFVLLDHETIGISVDKINWFVVVQECSNNGSWGAMVVAWLMVDCFELFDALLLMIGGDDILILYVGLLEELWLLSVDCIFDGVCCTLVY